MTPQIDNRPLFQLTVSEFKDLITTSIPEVKNEIKPIEPTRVKINGIRGLADFLDVSLPTAQRLKNGKSFPFYASGNKVYFFSDEVNAGLKVEAKMNK
jgi:hypothetical protein